MKVKRIISIYDEKYYGLVNLTAKNLMCAKISYEDYLGFTKVIRKKVGKEPEVIGLFRKFEDFKNIDKENIKYHILLSKKEIQILNVLLDIFINSESEKAKTDFYTIYHRYLGKKVNNETYDYGELINILNKLDKLYIFEGFVTEKKDNSNTFKLINMKVNRKQNKIDIEYSLGKFGEKIRNRKRFGDILPMKHIRKNNINQFIISLSISRYIFINLRKKDRDFSFSLRTLLNNISYFDKEGNNTGLTYYDLLYSTKISNKTYILRKFINTIENVCVDLQEKNKICKFEIPNEKASVNKIDSYIISITIQAKNIKCGK